MNIRSILVFVTLSAILLLPSCKGNSKNTAETEPEEVLPEDIVELRQDQIDLAEIQTGTIELRTLSGTLKVNGTVSAAPQNQASVCVPMGGFIKKTSLMPGNTVRKGQVLAVIENQEFIDIQQNYLEAKSKLSYAEAEYKRQSDLYKSDVSSQKNLQQATSEYKTFKAQTYALRQKLLLIGINPSSLREDNIRSFVNVVSPISGYVKAVNINLGKNIAPSDVLFEIVNCDKLFLELTLFDKDADKVSNGQNIRFFINNETEQHNAVIYQTGKSIGTDKTYKVYASVSSSCKNVLPGMYVNALIESSTSKVTAVPSGSLVNFDGKDYLFILEKTKTENGKPFTEYRMVEVQKGVTDGGYTEVKLPADFDQKNSKVVVKGAYNLLAAKKNAGEMSC
jgi:membrane fusion protein, heavy metal efflux system